MAACRSNLPVHIDIDSFILVFSFYCHSSPELSRPSLHFLFYVVACTDQTVHTDVFFPPAQPTQDNISMQTGVCFPVLQPTQANSSTRTSTFHRHLPSLAHKDVFQSLARPTQVSLSIWTFFPTDIANTCFLIHADAF